jgi:hypothetical protein
MKCIQKGLLSNACWWLVLNLNVKPSLKRVLVYCSTEVRFLETAQICGIATQ